MSKGLGQQLRESVAESTIQIPGAASLLVSLLAQEMGFHAVHLSAESLGAMHAKAPSGDDVVTETRAIAPRIEIPLMVDPGAVAPNEAARLTEELEAAGAAAIVMSDEFERRVMPLDVASRMYESAVSARRDAGAILVAKTVVRRFGSLEESIARAKLYLAAGADWIQPEGLTSYPELQRFAHEIDAPLAANMDEHQETPLLTAEELAGLGYAAAIYPMSLLRVAMKAIEGALDSLAESGSQHEFLEIMSTNKELAKLVATAKK